MTLQHLVHEPQDFPGTRDGLEAAFQSSPKYSDAAGAAAPALPALLRFASPILMLPTVTGRLSEGSIELLEVIPIGWKHSLSVVMPGLVPGTHVFRAKQDVGGRDKPGHDALDDST